MNQYSKGSTWRIWDLQIQTILDDRYESLSSYYAALKAEDPDKWNTFINKVGGEADALLFDSKSYFTDTTIPKNERCTNYVRTTFAFFEVYKPNLGVIGITDHNYYDDDLIDEFYKYSKSTNCQVICGVEINVGGVHMLVYFDKPPFDKTTFSEGIKTFLSKIDVDSRIKDGVLTLSNKSCHDVIEQIKTLDGIYLFPHCNSDNGLFQERGKTDRTHLAEIYNCMPTVILQGSGKENIDKTAKYISSNASLKSTPIYTIASDARCINEFGNPDKDGNYMWIKGDPTFEGLKQIQFEPVTRVRIEKDKPEVKKDYLVIDKVKFIDSDMSELFSDSYLQINDKLNGIIGGKSSGKSILLYYIAKTIDEQQVKQKIADSNLDLSYDFDADPNFDFEVVWQDGEVYRLKDKSKEKSRQITYVPQMFINYLAEKGGQPELRKLIQGILEQKPEFKALYDSQTNIIQENNVLLTAEIEKYYQIIEAGKKNNESLKSKGDKNARLENVKQKNKEIDDLRKAAKFSEADEAEFQKLRNTQSIYTGRFTNLTGLKLLFENDYLPHLNTLKTAIGPSLNNIYINSISKFSTQALISSFLAKYITKDNVTLDNTFDELIVSANTVITKIDTLLSKNEVSLIKYRALLAPYMAKIKDQEKLDALNKEISDEQKILNEIADLEVVRTNLLANLTTAKQAFLEAYKNVQDAYVVVAKAVNENPEFSEISADKGIRLSCKIGFDAEKFNNTVISLINNQGYLAPKLGGYINDDNGFVYDDSSHLSSIEDFFTKLQSAERHNIKFNRAGDVQTVSKKLFQDLFIIQYELSQGDESILKMSPGKKGMILLFLILHLSNAEYPILIDQPEDNLDNRTVYKELKEFIKEKKIVRQILMVTHNANLIVPTDAENIIVANQRGQDSKKDNEKFRFEYVSGSLENSFIDSKGIGILNQMGIKEHVCDILEGGTDAFKERELKYSLKH